MVLGWFKRRLGGGGEEAVYKGFNYESPEAVEERIRQHYSSGGLRSRVKGIVLYPFTSDIKRIQKHRERKRIEKQAKEIQSRKEFNELVEAFEAMGYDYEEAVVLARAQKGNKKKKMSQKEYELLIEAGKIRAEARRYGIELSEDDAIAIARSKKRRERFEKLIQNMQQKTAQMGAGGQQPSGLARLVNVISPQRGTAGRRARGQPESWENTPPSWLGDTGGGPSWLYDQSSGLSNLLAGGSGGGPHWLLGGSTDSKMANLLLGDSGGGPKWLQNQKKRSGKKRGTKGKNKGRR